MKYLREYLKAFLTISAVLGIVYFVFALLGANAVAWYYIYVALFAGFAGPISVLLEKA